MLDELGRSSNRSGDDRRSTCHGLDHHETERFWPVDRKDHGVGLLEKMHLRLVVDVFEDFDVGAEQRGNGAGPSIRRSSGS